MSTSKRRAISLRKLTEVWRRYSEFKRGQVAPSTYIRDYEKITRRITRLRKEAPYIENAIEIRDWLVKHYSAEVARRTLVQFNACCKWGYESEMLQKNPFEGIQKHIKLARPSETAWAAFTTEERDAIIQEFESNHPYYAPWVKFLFWTGCRPEEAAALRWEHIAMNFSEVLFICAAPSDMKEVQGTKNRKSTRFPCNPRLQSLLKELKPSPCDHSSLVFQARTGGRFNYTNFQTRYWRPIIKEMVKRGALSFYLSQYHCRHTWITEALNHLSVADVSYLARVSTAVLYQHYAGRSRSITIPEF